LRFRTRSPVPSILPKPSAAAAVSSALPVRAAGAVSVELVVSAVSALSVELVARVVGAALAARVVPAAWE
jgi:hypothetical protein